MSRGTRHEAWELGLRTRLRALEGDREIECVAGPKGRDGLEATGSGTIARERARLVELLGPQLTRLQDGMGNQAAGVVQRVAE